MERKTSVVTPERFASGMTFEQYVAYVGTPENLKREGSGRPRSDMTANLRAGYASAKLDDAQTAAITWLAARPNGPAKVLVISEEWSSDCRRDVPMLARLAEAGGLELRLFLRDAETMHRQGLPEPGSHPNADLVREYANEKNGQQFATVPVAVFFTRDFAELYRYIEYPAIYRKDRVLGALRKSRPGETEEQTKARGGREIGNLLESPFFEVWARAGVAEIVSALHERLVTA